MTYYDDDDGGKLDCPRCAKGYEFDLRYDAMAVIRFHLNPDQNEYIDACSATRWTIAATPWEAVDSQGSVTARGRVIVEQTDTAIQSEVVQDWSINTSNEQDRNEAQ